MYRILIVTPNRDGLAEFEQGLMEYPEVRLAWANSGASALSDVMQHPPVCVIIESNLPDFPGLELVRRLLPINAMIQTALISDLPSEIFHDVAEGLGIMAQLCPPLTGNHAGGLISRLKRLTASGALVSSD